ncbi:MAG: hypothetical protein WCR44_00100 [Verrucomicrobiota bacterium]
MNHLFSISTAIACLFLISSPIMRADTPPKKISLSDFPAAAVEEVVVPVPSEIFAVLDKLGNPNWKGQLRDGKVRTPEDRARTALLLGNVIAEGFVAVEAEDAERVKELGRQVLTLAEAINVRKSVIARSKSITDKADQRDWRGVRAEFDGALQDVRGAMQELNDQDLSQLVSLGGWLRGTEVLTSIVGGGFSKDGTELLHQPELVNYFDRCIGSMGGRLRKNPLVASIRDVLRKIGPIVNEGGDKITPEQVKSIHNLTHGVNQQIVEGTTGN